MTVAFQAQGSTVTLSVRSPTTPFNIPSATITELLGESANVAPHSVLPIANVPLSTVTAIPTDMASSGPKTRRPKGNVTISAIPKEIPANPNPASTSTAKRGREAEEPELQLNDLHLPEAKRRRGRPRAARKLRQYALSQKPFPKKNLKEKALCKFLFSK